MKTTKPKKPKTEIHWHGRRDLNLITKTSSLSRPFLLLFFLLCCVWNHESTQATKIMTGELDLALLSYPETQVASYKHEVSHSFSLPQHIWRQVASHLLSRLIISQTVYGQCTIDSCIGMGWDLNLPDFITVQDNWTNKRLKVNYSHTCDSSRFSHLKLVVKNTIARLIKNHD